MFPMCLDRVIYLADLFSLLFVVVTHIVYIDLYLKRFLLGMHLSPSMVQIKQSH